MDARGIRCPHLGYCGSLARIHFGRCGTRVGCLKGSEWTLKGSEWTLEGSEWMLEGSDTPTWVSGPSYASTSAAAVLASVV